jgi:hypothetical protein
MAWEMFGGSAPKTRIMIRKIAIRHADKHNRPRGHTIYQINQHLSVVLQRGVGEQLIAYECAGRTLASQLTLTTIS